MTAAFRESRKERYGAWHFREFWIALNNKRNEQKHSDDELHNRRGDWDDF